MNSPAANIVSISSKDEVSKCPSTCFNKLSLWHNILGHINFVSLKSILKLCNIPLPNKDCIEFCSSCSVGKSHRLHASLSKTVYSTAIELVHVDLWGRH